jgi:hypothetical protein
MIIADRFPPFDNDKLIMVYGGAMKELLIEKIID